MKKLSINAMRNIAFSGVGAVAGLVYYYFFACSSGCPIASSPVLTSLYMALVGFLLSQLFERSN